MNNLKPENFWIRRLNYFLDDQIQQLAALLIDSVEGGAVINYMHPLSLDKALAFWHGVAQDIEIGDRVVLVAEDTSGIVGTVQIVFAQPENQLHTADISKILVHTRFRRLGIGAALLNAAEDVARESGKSLLVLTTARGDAERLYIRRGWQLAGIIPDYAVKPNGGLCGACFYYRKLD